MIYWEIYIYIYISLLTSCSWKCCMPFWYLPLSGAIALPATLESCLGHSLFNTWWTHSVSECLWTSCCPPHIFICGYGCLYQLCSGFRGDSFTAAEMGHSPQSGGSSIQAVVDEDALSSGAVPNFVGGIIFPQTVTKKC